MSDRSDAQRLGVLGLVLACFVNVIGVLVSVVALHRSRRNNEQNPAAIAGITIGLLSVVAMIVAGVVIGQLMQGNIGLCADPTAEGYALACTE